MNVEGLGVFTGFGVEVGVFCGLDVGVSFGSSDTGVLFGGIGVFVGVDATATAVAVCVDD